MLNCALYAVVLSESESGTDLSGCNCPPRCTNFDHRATVSSSRLSDVMIKYFLSNNSELDRRYVNAVETRNRVASTLLSCVIGHLENLVAAHLRLKEMLTVDLVEHTTSVPGQILASINVIVQQTQDSLAEFRSQIFDKFSDHYEQSVDFSVTQLVTSAKSILYYLANTNVNNSDMFNVSLFEIIADYKNAFCEEDQYVYYSNDFKTGNFSAKLFVDKSCETEELFNYCDNSEFPTLTQNNTEYVNELITLIESTTVLARTVLKCAPMYGTFLHDIQSWLEPALTLNSSVPLRPADHRYVLVELEHELNWLISSSRTFAEKSMVRSFSIQKPF